MRWAIIIGIDEYGDDDLRLSASVSDALAFRAWAVERGGVPEEQVRLLLSRRSDDPAPEKEVAESPTRDNIVSAIDRVMREAGPDPDRLYFYFAGHGLTARIANRDESALVTLGFNELHADQSLSVPSLTEHLETTPFRDQFLFIDACRNIPWDGGEFLVGRWPVPRRRDPGAPPVQQFILYATSPGRTAQEVGLDERAGAFTRTLLEGLRGAGDAKAWSWERSRYEVRWERLAGYVNAQMRARIPEGADPRTSLIQVPQDTGARGVADRERDIALASFASSDFSSVALTVDLQANAEHGDAELSVLDGAGQPVVRALGVTGRQQTFRLPPRTYAVRATTAAPRPLAGTAGRPVDLYDDDTVKLELKGTDGVVEPPGEDLLPSGREPPLGTLVVHSHDPLFVAEIRDETGHVVGVRRPEEKLAARAGFYAVRPIGPESTEDGKRITLGAGKRSSVTPRPAPPDVFVAELVEALGGHVQRDGYVVLPGSTGCVSWACPSTIVAGGVAAALRGEPHEALGAGDVGAALAGAKAGVAVFAVARDGKPEPVAELRVRAWRAGTQLDRDGEALDPSAAGVGGTVVPIGDLPREPLTYWVSLRADDKGPLIPVPILPGRLATLVAQVDADRLRLYQYHPRIRPDADGDDLRRVEYLERMLLTGRLDVAAPLAAELAGAAREDPFGGLVAGYVLLRLGRHDALDGLASAILDVAPGLADAFILRGEHAAHAGQAEASTQAFAEAVNAGLPAFGEGLTRLVEGVRTNGLLLPRGAVVRYMFQRHVRGSMWASFLPADAITPGRTAISAGDLGFSA